jgi:hypothetical protein
MGKIVMTLLVRRVLEENAKCPYGVQISLPKELTPREMLSLTSVRLISTNGVKASVFETMDSYHPHEWRAASLREQTQFAAKFNANPAPWYCVMFSLSKNVYDYPGAGDKDSNNGQVWADFASSDAAWTTGQALRGKCQEELDAEWNKRMAEVNREQLASGFVSSDSRHRSPVSGRRR